MAPKCEQINFFLQGDNNLISEHINLGYVKCREFALHREKDLAAT